MNENPIESWDAQAPTLNSEEPSKPLRLQRA